MAINANNVRLVGEETIVRPLIEALALAQRAGLDLVQLSNDEVPAVKIIDYGKFRYEQQKKQKQQQKKNIAGSVQVKELRFSATIEEHDLNTKLNHAKKFLQQGKKVRVVIQFKGRQVSHPELGAKIADNLLTGVTGFGVLEDRVSRDGRNITFTVAPV